MQAIVLCGGLGTRLRSVINELPKPMAPVNGRPFLEFVLEYLKAEGVSEVVLAVSYKREIIEAHFGFSWHELSIKYSVENELLGTGGAIKQALSLCDENELFVLNGDTFFDISLKCLSLENSKICLALKKMHKFDRYGCVKLDEMGLVSGFEEKKFMLEGLINGGVYLVKKDLFDNFELEVKFSFEDFLQNNFSKLNARAVIFEDYFMDIGIPQDYAKFCEENL